jgi:serine/threonine protein kinase
VYEAEHTVKRVNVALKVISPRHSQDQSFRLRMQRNVAAVARIRNAVPEPQIVPIFDWGEINERPYVVMPVVDGIDLERSLAHDGRFSPAQAVGLLGQIASALDALHSQGWMHRNVRPNNIIVGRDLTSLLSGFQYLTVDLGGHTHPMNYAYSAPEEFTNDGTTFRTDIYALTCVFYECLTGDLPYRGDSMEAVIRGHIQQPAPRPSSNAFPADIPASLDDVIACGMAKEPDRRYASAGALALAARQALAASGRA